MKQWGNVGPTPWFGISFDPIQKVLTDDLTGLVFNGTVESKSLDDAISDTGYLSKYKSIQIFLHYKLK